MISCDINNNLNIDFTLLLGYPCKIFITPWESGIEWTNTSESSSSINSREYKFGIPFNLIKQDPNSKPWIETIPQEIMGLMDEYETKYPELTFFLLYYISTNNNALELFINNKIFTFILFRYAISNNIKLTDIVDVTSCKLQNILEFCDLPSSKSAVKFLQKIDFDIYDQEQYLLLRYVLVTGFYRKFSHLDKIKYIVIKLLILSPYFYKLAIHDVNISELEFNNIKYLFRDITRMATVLGIFNIDNLIFGCKSISNLTKVHDKLTEKINLIKPNDEIKIHYNDPPIKGNENIVPITTLKELIVEGACQCNCVKNYNDRILSGEYYIYKVLSPERSTLGLEKCGFNHFKIDQIKGKLNRKVSVETEKIVFDWLNLAYGKTLRGPGL